MCKGNVRTFYKIWYTHAYSNICIYRYRCGVCGCHTRIKAYKKLACDTDKQLWAINLK